MGNYKKDLVKRCKNYCADEDSTGAIGHGLADELVNTFPISEERPSLLTRICEDKWQKYNEIVEQSNLKFPVANKKKQRLKGVLGKLKRAGMSIKDYSGMRTSDLWNYYVSKTKEIRSHVL